MNEFDQWNGKKTAAYILLAVAGYIVLSRTGVLDFFGLGSLVNWVFRAFWNLVPSAILAMGVFWLVRSDQGEKPAGAWFVIVLGLVLLISQFNLFGLSFMELVLPTWLVLIAFMLMNPRKLLPRFLNAQKDEISEDSSTIKLVAFMGGGELDYTCRDLRGGEVLAVWGGYQIDFTQADMEGDSMELNLCCIMGGVEITIPPNWELENRGTICILGAYSNKSKCLAEQLELPKKKLKVSGLALMGGGEIRN